MSYFDDYENNFFRNEFSPFDNFLKKEDLIILKNDLNNLIKTSLAYKNSSPKTKELVNDELEVILAALSFKG